MPFLYCLTYFPPDDDGERIAAKLLDIMKKEGKAASATDLASNGWLHYACFAARPLVSFSSFPLIRFHVLCVSLFFVFICLLFSSFRFIRVRMWCVLTF